MSAELILYSIVMYGKHNPNHDMNDRRIRMKEAATIANEIEINEYRTKMSNDMGYTWEETENPTELMINTIDNFFDSLDNNDVSWRIVGNYTIWITGGMSWGDDPSESYGIFEKFAALPTKILMSGGFEE